MKQFFKNLGAGLKESARKFMVSLKRRPHNIALVMLLISFVYYSLNLTNVSNTTAYINKPHMGLCSFGTMLLSVLSFVCFLNAFPKRKKPVIIMVVLLYLMMGIIIFADCVYYTRIIDVINSGSEIKNTYVFATKDVVIVHIVLEAITALLTALIPVYGALLAKINTSVEIEDRGEISAVEFDEE